MAKIDLEKFICSLMQFTTVSREIKYLINCALRDQGLEYKDGAIVEIEPKEEPTEYERGYRQAIDDAWKWFGKGFTKDTKFYLEKPYKDAMEQNLKEK